VVLVILVASLFRNRVSEGNEGGKEIYLFDYPRYFPRRDVRRSYRFFSRLVATRQPEGSPDPSL